MAKEEAAVLAEQRQNAQTTCGKQPHARLKAPIRLPALKI
jgi:hypothetical protein